MPPDAKRRPGPGGAAQDLHRQDQVEGHGTSAVARPEALAIYTDRRERVLGRHCTIPEDPDGAAEVLTRIHGGERRAAAWLRSVLGRLDGQGWS